MSNLIEIKSVEQFNEITSQDGLVLVDFWAQWCGPCKMVLPVLETIAGEREDITIAKVDADQDSTNSLLAKNGVRGIPTMLLYKDGVRVGQKVGAASKAALEDFINAHA